MRDRCDGVAVRGGRSQAGVRVQLRRRLQVRHRAGSKRHALLWPVLLTCAALVAATTSAQEVPAVDTPEPAKEDLIAHADIPLRGDTDEQFALAVLGRSTQLDPASNLTRRLERLETGVHSLEQSYVAADLNGLAPLGFESLEKHWKFYERHLSLWHEELEKRTRAFATDAAELAKRRKTWTATAADADRSLLAPALRERAALVVAEIERAEQSLAQPLETALILDRRGNRVRIDIERGLTAVRRSLERYRLSLLEREMPALWDPASATPGLMSTSARFGIRVEAAFIRDYVRVESTRLTGYLLVWALMLPPLLWLAYRQRHNTLTVPVLTVDSPVVRRPFSAWLVLGALVGP
ncbi:MAG TPA: hypothetical protein VFS23_24700, partial [Vicinamibacterales bacterium]|nr:hypothetical protein [Vicinamibacterales bacterium]